MDKPTSFELAVVAAILSLRNPRSQQPAENWLRSAHALLSAADSFQPSVSREAEHEWMLMLSGKKSFPFATVLMEMEPPKAGKKKGRTRVGAITTQKGLFKAIRRVFLDDAEDILKRGSLYGFEIKELIADQHVRTKSRTSVANKSKSKPVK